MMKFSLIIIFLIVSLNVFSQSNYVANSHVDYNIEIVDEDYVINYMFKDHHNRICSVTWNLNKKRTDADIEKFGVPKLILKPYRKTPEIVAKRKKIISRGLFKVDNNTITVDKNAMLNEYAGYTKIIAEWMIKYLNKHDEDNRTNRIRLAMCFVQDIPYAIPDDFDPNWYYGGVIATPNIFTCGYGDCDTKAILFVGILCHLIDHDYIRFAGEPGHIYTIIKNRKVNIVKNGTTTYFELDDGEYVVAETAGPARLAFGEKGNYHYSVAEIEKIIFHETEK